MVTKDIKKTIKNLHKSIAQSLACFTRSQRALSPVISSLVLIAVVIILGFAALSYARSISGNYEIQYQENINSDINKLKETLTFEYIYYNSSGYVRIYFMNTGTNNLEVYRAYLSTYSGGIEPVVKFLSGATASNKILAVGEERFIDLSTTALTTGSYTVHITTVRGSNFEYTFVV